VKGTYHSLKTAKGCADIEIQANEILHHKLTLNGYLAEFTGQSMEQITMDTDRDFFMSAQEAVEYGLIDAVISKPSLVLASNGMAGLAAAGA
jgi:ATP-dependent Clp protease, protease subunit